MAAGERVFGLDLLRAVAILVVVYGHGLHFASPDLPLDLLARPILDGGTLLLRLYLVETRGFDSGHEWDYGLKMLVVTRMDSLMFGVLGAYLSLYHKDLWTRAGHPLVFWSGVALLVFDRFMRLDGDNMAYLNYFALTLTPVATLLLLPRLSAWHTLPGPVGRAITFISVISYSMYLINQALIAETLIPALMPGLMHLLWRFGDHIHLIQFILFWVLTLAGSAALYHFYEKPMTHLRDRFGKGHRTPAHAFKHPT